MRLCMLWERRGMKLEVESLKEYGTVNSLGNIVCEGLLGDISGVCV